MSNIAWMAWTLPTAIFFLLLGGTLSVMIWLAVKYPEVERVGILRIPTTRGDRLFVTLILAAVIHLMWIGFIGVDPLITLPGGENGFDISNLWLATIIALGVGVLVFKKV